MQGRMRRTGIACLAQVYTLLLLTNAQLTNAASTTTTTSSTTSSSTSSTTTTDDSTTTTDGSASTASGTSTTTSTTATGIVYPSASVPPTENAPYMQKSNLPNGTIFIAVGAILGFFALAVLAWRGLVAWSINRSIRRAAAIQSHRESKSHLRGRRKSNFYDQNPDSTMSMSMEKLATEGRQPPAQAKAPAPSTNLFFSPTAGIRSTGSGSRVSSYLPAGYYGASNAAAGAARVLGPRSQGYSRASSTGPSPPESPEAKPKRHGSKSHHRRRRSQDDRRHSHGHESGTERGDRSSRSQRRRSSRAGITHEELMSHLNSGAPDPDRTYHSRRRSSNGRSVTRGDNESDRSPGRKHRHSRRHSSSRRDRE